MGTHEAPSAANPVVSALVALWHKIQSEPVMVTQIVAATLSVLAVWGFALPVATAAAIMSTAQIVAGLIARQKVAPLAKYSAARADGHGPGDPADPANPMFPGPDPVV